MGNTICQRILSKDPELLHQKWKQVYNNVSAPHLYFSKEIEEVISEIRKANENLEIRKIISPAERINKDELAQQAVLERSLQSVRGLVPAEILKEYPGLGEVQLLQSHGSGSVINQIDAYRLEMCFVLHTWFAYISKELGKTEEDTLSDDPVKVVLDHFGKSNDKIFADKVLELSLKLLLGELKEVIEQKNKIKLLTHFTYVKQVLESLEADKKAVFEIDEGKGEAFKLFQSILISFIEVLKNDYFLEELDKGLLQEIYDLTGGLVFKIGSIRLHLVFIEVLKHLLKKEVKIDFNTLKDVDAEATMNLGVFSFDEKLLKKLKFTIEDESTVRNRFQEDDTMDVVPYKNMYIVEHKSGAKALLERSEKLGSVARTLYSESYCYNCEPYVMDDEVFVFDSDDYYISKLDLENLRVKKKIHGVRASARFYEEKMCDHHVNKLRFFEWDDPECFIFAHKNLDNIVYFNFLRMRDYNPDRTFTGDEEKYKDYNHKYVVTIKLLRKPPPGEYHYEPYREYAVVTADNKIYTGMKGANEDGQGPRKQNRFGDFITFRNKGNIHTVHITSGRVVSVQPGNKFFDGYDHENQQVITVADRDNEDFFSLEFRNVVNLMEFNRAMEVLYSRKLLDEGDLAREAAKDSFKVQDMQDIGSDDSVEISDDEEDSDAKDGDATNRGLDELFGVIAEQGKKENQGAKNGEEFILGYLDFLTRSTFSAKVHDVKTEVAKMKAEDLQKFLFDKNKVENNEVTYQLLYKMIKRYRTITNELESSILLFLLKLLEHHLELLEPIQNNTKTGLLVSYPLLKKLKKLVGTVSPKKTLYTDLTYKGLERSKEAIDDIIDQLCKSSKKTIQHLRTQVKADLSSVLEETKRLHTEDEIFGLFKNLANYGNQLGVEDTDDILTALWAKFEAASLNKLVDKELKLLENGIGTKLKHFEDSFKDLYVFQANLNKFFDAFVAYGSNKNYQRLFESFLAKFLKKISCLNTIRDAAIKKYGGDQNPENPDSKRKLFDNFDNFFSRSIIGNVISFTSAMKEYANTGVFKSGDHTEGHGDGQDAEVRKLIFDTHFSVIDLVNSCGGYLNYSKEKSLPTKEDTFDVEFKQGEGLIVSKTIDPNISYILSFDEIPKKGTFVNIFKPQDFHSKRNHYRTLEFIGSLNHLTGDESFEITNADKIYLACVMPTDKDLESQNIKATLTPSKGNWRSKLNFVNLAKIVLSSISENAFKELHMLKSEETQVDGTGVLSKFDEKTQNKLDKILGSKLFENGVQKILYEQAKFELKTEDLSELEISKLYKDHIFDWINIKNEAQEVFEKHCRDLQKQVKKRGGLYTNLGGEIGYCCSVSLFIVILKHKGILEFFTEDMESPSNLNNESYDQIWLECSNIRMLTRKIHTKRELVSLFNKLKLCLTIDSKDTFLSTGNLGGDLLSKEITKTETFVRNSTINEDIQGTDWGRVKNYLNSIRRKSSNSFKQDKEEDSLVRLIIKFIQIPVEASTILSLLEKRRERFDLSTRALGFMEKLTSTNHSSILCKQILSTFEKTFRPVTQPFTLTYLTLNYNGLDKNLITKQMELITNIIKSKVEIICSPDTSHDIRLLALQNLKWIYKGRESGCVMAIDIKRIWETNLEFFKKKQEELFEPVDKDFTQQDNLDLINSILDLIEILVRFCVRKIQQQSAQSENQDALQRPTLGLRRHVSVVDSSSMSNILTKNLSILIKEMIEGTKNIDEIDSFPTEDFDLIHKSERCYQSSWANSSSHVLHTFVSREYIENFFSLN